MKIITIFINIIIIFKKKWVADELNHIICSTYKCICIEGLIVEQSLYLL